MSPIWLDESKTVYELLDQFGVSAKIYYHDMSMAMTFKMLQGGFETVPDGPLSWTMWREPQASNQRSPLVDANHVSQRAAAGVDRR